MNCTSCGAPISSIDSTGHYRCNYCQTIACVRVVDESLDRITLTSFESKWDCPCCHERLFNGSLEKQLILGCRACFGYLTSRPAFAHIVHQRRAAYRGADIL